MTSCLSGAGGGRAAAYGGFDLEMVKSLPSTTTRATSHSTPSPSSTLSESNSPLAISTRKPRTPRKRPNQTYNEAAALLSTAYPNIFSCNSRNSTSSSRFFGIKSLCSDFDEASELLLPFESVEEPDFLFHPPLQAKTDPFFGQKEVSFGGNSDGRSETGESEATRLGLFEDFDAESILDEETEEGIDSIMGNVKSNEEENHGDCDSRVQGMNLGGNCYGIGRLGQRMMDPRYGFGGNLHLGFELRSALRDNDDENWWRFSIVDIDQISPRIKTTKSGNKKKKTKTKKTVAMAAEERRDAMLKLDYKGVMEAWSDRASPFTDFHESSNRKLSSLRRR